MLFSKQTPVQVSAQGSPLVYRFWTVGSYTSGDVQITFKLGKVHFTNNTTSSFTGPVLPVNFTVDGVATPNIHYLDVQLKATAGDVILSTGVNYTFEGSGAGALSVLLDAKPTQLTGTSVYRYFVSGSFAAGAVTIRFPAGSITSGQTAIGSLETVGHFTVQQLTAQLADPQQDSAVSLGQLNSRGYVDVTYTVPAYAQGVDVASVLAGTPQFTIAPQDPAKGTIALDTTQAPVLIVSTATTFTFRYFTIGTLRPPDPAQLTFIGGTLNFEDSAGKSIPLFGPEQLKLGTGGAFVEVFFGESPTLDSSSVGAGAITVTDAAGAVLTVGAPAAVDGKAGTFKFPVSGTSLAAGQQVTVAFAPASWTYESAPGTHTAATQQAPVSQLGGDTYIDVRYSSAGGVALETADFGTKTQLGPLTGPGAGTALLDTAQKPTILVGGQTVRYYFSPQFAAGTVSVTFLPGSWSDKAGNLGIGGAGEFRLFADPQASGGAQTTTNRVFFISISGGMELRAGGLFSDSKNTPLLAIRGGAELDIGTRVVNGKTLNRFELTASGSIEVIKIGNIASGAAVFVLETGGTLSSTSFWGVAAFQTNFDFLQPYGIVLKGSALLEINTTNQTQTEKLTLEGIPGGTLFAVPTSGSNASLLAALPTNTFDPVPLPAAWASLFSTPPVDRNLDGILDSDPGQPSPLALTLGTGQKYTLESFGPTALQAAKVEGTIPGKEWRIINGDGRQFFLQAATDKDENAIVIVRGEQRTYNLAPVSFLLEVVGGATLYDPSTMNSA